MIRIKADALEHFVTCGQMKLLEQRADADGLSYYQMMENAGTRATQLIRRCCELARVPLVEPQEELPEENVEELPEKTEASKHRHAMIFCGKGNNGGDGFVVARVLAQAGYQVTVVLVSGEPKTEDAMTNFRLLDELPVKLVDLTETEDILHEKSIPDLLVDAMFGTGFHGRIHGSALNAVEYINSCREHHGTTVFALDIPSGLGGDQLRRAAEDDPIIRADYTITFHARKPVHLQRFAEDYCGEILVADIGIDENKLMTVEI